MLLIPIYAVALALAIYGYVVAGLPAIVTALVSGYIVASVYTGRLSSLSPMVAPAYSELGKVQRVRAAVAFVLIGAGIVCGGWRWGWAGALIAYAIDYVAGSLVAWAVLKIVRP